MKKLIALIGIVIVAITSCVKNNETIEEEHNKKIEESVYQNSPLLRDLSEYNTEYKSMNPETRAGQKWLRFCAVMGADLIGVYEGCRIGVEVGVTVGGVVGHPIEGAVIGGVIAGSVCGIGASYVASKSVSECAILSDDILFDQLYNFMTDNYSRIQEIKESQLNKTPIANQILVPEQAIVMGALHNEGLSKLNSETLYNVTKVSNCENLYLEQGVDKQILLNSDFRMGCKDHFALVLDAKTSPIGDSLPDKVMELYYELISGNAITPENMVNHINSYYSIVKNSQELTSQEKDCIYTGLSVSLFSFDYWKDHYELD